MKNSIVGKRLALLICSIAMAIAATSSSMCIWWFIGESKMPISLYKVD